MRIQWKVILLVLIVLVGTVSAVVWKTQSLLLEDKIGFITDANVKQTAPLRKLVETKLTQEKEHLVGFASAKAGAGKSSFGDFEVVSLMQPGEGGQWSPAWVEKAAAAKEERWPQGYDLTLLKSLPYSKVKDGEVVWARLSDTQGMPIFALMVSVEVASQGSAASGDLSGQLPETTDYGSVAPAGSGKKAIIVGFASVNPVAGVTDEFIGSLNTVFLVDDKGYVASHTNKSYLGALFSEDPIVQEIMKSQKTSGTGRFEDLESQPIIGHFEKIDRSNVYAVVTTPLAAATGLADSFVQLALVTGGAVGVIGLILAWLVGRGISSHLQRVNASVQAIAQGDSLVNFQPVSSGDEIGALTQNMSEAFRAIANRSGGDETKQETKPEANQVSTAKPKAKDDDDPFAEMLEITRSSVTPPAIATAAPSQERLADERRVAFEAFNEGVTASVKEPLMAILGHAQLARTKTDDAAIRAHADSIEREARRAKEVLERLQDFENDQPALNESDRMDLESVVKAAVAKVKPDFDADGIDLTVKSAKVPEVRGYAPQMESAIVHLLENASEALLNRPVKKVFVTLKDEGAGLSLEIADTGIGMSRDVKDKVFEPFFKHFENPRRMGLGLSFVNAAIKRIGAKTEIDSSPGEGTKFRLKFNVTGEERKAFEAAQMITQSPPPVITHSITPVKVETKVPQPPPIPPPAKPAFPPPPPDAENPAVMAPLLGGKMALGDRDEVTANMPVPPPPDDELPAFPGLDGLKLQPAIVLEHKEPEDEVQGSEDTIVDEETAESNTSSDSLSFIDDEDDEEDMVIATARPMYPPIPPPKAEPPAGASVARPEPVVAVESLVDDYDSDDDEEHFSNITLNRAMMQPLAEPPPVEAPAPAPPAASAQADSSGFKVKIRRPRTKS